MARFCSVISNRNRCNTGKEEEDDMTILTGTKIIPVRDSE
jgi:hypothetical protein